MLRLIVCCLLLTLPSAAIAGNSRSLQEGAALLNAGQIPEAITVLREAERQLADSSMAAGLLGEAYLRLGLDELNHGREDAAREAFAEAKRYLPDDPRPWQGCGLAWLHSGQPMAAIGEFHEALAIRDDQPELYVLLGRAYYAAGDLVQAESAWQRAERLGGGEDVAVLLEKVRREQLAERTMSRDLAGRFSLAYAQGINDRVAAEVLDVLQEAYLELGRDFGYYPETDIPVLLYAREDFNAVTRSPEWAGAVYDGKIRVPLGGVKHMTPPLKALLYHEYAHVVVRYLAKGRAPVWLNEGLAEVAGRRHSDPPESRVPGGRRLDSGALDRSFGELPVEVVPLAYQQSYERVDRLIELCGWPPLNELLQRLGQGQQWEAAVAAAYAPCGYDWPRLRDELE